MKENRILGKIIQSDLEVIFVCEEHHFTFMRTDNSIALGKKAILKATDGFILGQTSDCKEILIYTNGDIEIIDTKDLYTWLYIVAEDKYQQLCDYDGIQFIDGVLKSLFFRNSLEVPILSESRFNQTDDTMIIDIHKDGIDKIEVRSIVSENYSIREGIKLDNSLVELKLIFEQTRAIRSSFQEEYNTMLELCRFLTFRKNITFDGVSLVSYKSCEDTLFEIGKCYIRRESEYTINRNPVHCITLNEIKPYLLELYLLVRSRDEKKSKYFVDFIPETPKELYRFTPELIRKVCTSAEFETQIRKITVAKNEHFTKLKNKIKEVIDQSKESDGLLTEKEYNYIIGSFNYLDGPLEERMKKLYELFEECIERILRDYDIRKISENEIHKMIKVRNGMSHGSAITSIDIEAYTAKAFMGIIYSSVLSRCKCSKEEIKEWIDDGLLTIGDD